MNKNTQILLGVGILGLGGYLYWKSTQKPTTAKMVGADGGKRIFKPTPSQRVFSATGETKTLPKQFFNVKSSPNAENNFKNATGFVDTPSSKVFANMVQPMGTQNFGRTGEWGNK